MNSLDQHVAAVLEAWRTLKGSKGKVPLTRRPVGETLSRMLDLLETEFEATSGIRALHNVATTAVELRDAASSQDAARITRAYTAFNLALDEWKRS